MLSSFRRKPGEDRSQTGPANRGQARGRLGEDGSAWPGESGTQSLTYAPFGVVESDGGLKERGLHCEPLSSEERSTLGLNDWLDGKVVPVLVIGKLKTCWIFVAKEYRDISEIRDVADTLRRHGYSLASEYQVVVVGGTLLLSISNGSFVASKALDLRDSKTKGELFQQYQDIIGWAHANGAADVDFQIQRNSQLSRVGLSIAGKWVYPDRFKMASEMMQNIVSVAYQHGKGAGASMMDMQAEQSLQVDLTLRDKDKSRVLLRWAAMAADHVYSVTLRITKIGESNRNVPLPSLGYLPDHMVAISRTMNSDGGAVIIAGVVDSGKSTSLNAMVDSIPSHQKVVTIEDPVESYRDGLISNTVVRKLTGEKSQSLTSKLLTLKRTGFNVLLLGEIRDTETARAAQEVFEAGNRLLTTVHTRDAWRIPDRIIGLGIGREILATPGNLRLLMYQALLPRNCGCALRFSELFSLEDGAYWRSYGERLQRLYDIDLGAVRVRNTAGCEHCRRADLAELNGLKGRESAVELIEPDDEFCDLVAKNDGIGMARYMAGLRGDIPFDDPRMTGKTAMECAIYKMSQGLIDPREIEPKFRSFESVEAMRNRPRPRVHAVGAVGLSPVRVERSTA